MSESNPKPRIKRTPEQLAAHHQARANRIRARLSRQQRAEDTRRKVIAGASLLGLVEAGDEDAKRVLAKITAGLTRPQDREAFGLPELEGADAAPTSAQAGTTAQPAPDLTELEGAIAHLMERNRTATSADDKTAIARVWRRKIAEWETAAGRLYPFPAGSDRSKKGLGGLGEVLAGF